MSVRKGGQIIAGTPRTTGGVEIGDMGFAPLGIDESLNLRRYMNGQVISQSQFVSFTNKVKSAVALFPSLATTESNWQSEKALSKFGQVGKFVIDDTAQTIRLPAVVNPQGLLGLSGIGNLVNESLPNISGDASLGAAGQNSLIVGHWSGTGFFSTRETTDGPVVSSGGTTTGATHRFLTADASRSSSTYQDNAPVQQEAIQYPYYIQVATGVEETLPAIREYNINTPFFFGQSMYSDIAPDNASWLASNGQYNAKTVYPDYYNWLVEQMNKGVEGFKGTTAYQFKGNTTETEAYTPSFTTRNPIVGSVIYGGSPIQAIGYATQVNADGSVVVQDVVNNITATLVFKQELPNIAWFTDYDFVINTADQTFRLPLLDGSEDLRGNSYETWTLQPSGSLYTASKNGILEFSASGSDSSPTDINGWMYIRNITTGETDRAYTTYNISITIKLDVSKGDQVEINYGNNVTAQFGYLHFFPAVGNGTLYYYVGDTVQDASLINAGAVLGQLATKTSSVEAAAASMPSSRYINLTLGASGSTYTAPANGWFAFYCESICDSRIVTKGGYFGNTVLGKSGFANSNTVSVLKGDAVTLTYSTSTGSSLRFYYCEGEE